MKQRLIIVPFILFLMNFLIFAQSEDSPDQTLKNLIDLFKSYNTAPKGSKLTPDQEARNKEISAKIENIFHYPTMINEAFKDQIPNMTKKQYNDFYAKFKTLIELVAYTQGSYFYKCSINTIKKSYPRGDKVVVPSDNYNQEKDRDVILNYVFKKIDDKWVLVDADLNDHSLCDEYRMQINRIVEKKGIPGLWEILVKKHEELTK